MRSRRQTVDTEPALGVRQDRFPGVLDNHQDLLEGRPRPRIHHLPREERVRSESDPDSPPGVPDRGQTLRCAGTGPGGESAAEGRSAKTVIADPISVVGVRAPSREMLGKTAVRPLLNRVVLTVCIFTAGSRELLGSRAVGETVGHRC